MISEAGEVPGIWEKANTILFYKGRKKDPGNYQSVSFTSVPGNIMEQNVLEVLIRHIEGRRTTGGSQHGFTKVKSYLTNLDAFYNERTVSVDKGSTVDVTWSPKTSFSLC